MLLTRYQEDLLFELNNNSLSYNYLIQGGAGSGKSNLLQYFSKNFQHSQNHNVIYFQNQVEYHNCTQQSFSKSILHKHLYSRELKENIFTSSLKIFLRNLGNKYSFLARIYFEHNDEIGLQVSSLLQYLEKLPKKNKKIIIFDNLNFWDSISIQTLYIFLKEIDSNKTTSSFLKNDIKIILAYSTHYYTSETLTSLVSLTKKNDNFKKFEFKNLSLNEIKNYMLKQNVSLELTDNYCSTIQKVSLNGNLAIINAACNYLRNKNFFKQDFIKNDINSVLKNLLFNENIAEKILSSATLFDMPFTKQHLMMLINKIFEFDEYETETNLEKGLEKQILEHKYFNNLHYIDFVDKAFANYLKEKNVFENTKYYQAFANLLQEIFPAQYKKRSLYNNLAANEHEADTLNLLHKIQSFRKGEWKDYNAQSSNNTLILRVFSQAYKSFYENMQEATINTLRELDLLSLDKRIQFEKDYLISIITLEIADKKSFNLLYEKNTKWINEVIHEKEIVIRAKSILFMIDMYRKEDILYNEKLTELIEIIESTTTVDSSLEYYLFSLKRRLRMVQEPEIASLSSRESVEYFQKYKNTNILFKREYFFSLVNHSDNLFQMNDLASSYTYAQKAYNFWKENNSWLPQITLINNFSIFYLLTYQKVDTGLFDKCIEYSNEIDMYCEDRSTYIMLFSNIASTYAYLGDLKNASLFLDKAFIILENQHSSFSRYSYHLEINREVINYFYKKKSPNFDSILNKNIYKNDNYIYNDKLLKKQIKTLEKVFSNQSLSFQSLWELNAYLASNYDNDSEYNRWNVINRSLKFFTMQYWSK